MNSPMTPRDVRLSRRIAVDYMIVGMAIGGAAEALVARIQPNEMLTHSAREMYEAAIAGDRDKFKEIFSRRTGLEFRDGESIGKGLVRIIKENNVDQYAFEVGDLVAEQLAAFDDLDDMIAILERATVALRQAKNERESVI